MNENVVENGYDIDSFLENLGRDRTATNGGNGSGLNRYLMNVRDNQGTLIMIPFMNKFKSFYSKISRVKEWKGATTKLDQGEAWYKILPKSYFPDLTQEESDLYDEVVGYYDTLADSERFDYDELRFRNYSLLYGIAISLTSTEGKSHDDIENKACLFTYPSAAPIDALSDAITQKVIAMKGKKDWIPLVLGVSAKGRQGALAITFKKGTIGYDASLAFELNGPLNMVVDPDKDVATEEQLKLFNDPVMDWLAWQGGTTRYFNIEVYKELRDSLKIAVKSLTKTEEPKKDSEPLENKNGNIDPMKGNQEAAPSSPAVDPQKSNSPF